jgi:alpha-tubulin suppressor-like RCC1 family protein
MRHAALIGAMCTVLLTACSEDTGPNISGIPALDIVRVNVAPQIDTIFVADTLRPTDRLQMSAEVIGRLGTPIPNAKVAWASSRTDVATITEGGVVIPTGYGTTEVSASASSVGKATIVVMRAARAVIVTPAMDTIFVEDPIVAKDSIKLTAKAMDEKGQVITGVAFTWASALTATATVNGAGAVLARSLGVVSVTARSGDQVGTGTVRVASVVKSIQLSAPVSTVLAKDTVQITATALGYDDKPMGGRTFTWTSSNPAVATVDGNGRAIFLRAGTATFTAKSALTTSAFTVTALERQFQSISSADEYTCGLTNLGRGYCWGVGDAGQLASGADSSCFDATNPGLRSPLGGGAYACTISPKRFAGPAIEFTAVDAGALSACGLSKDQLIYCWGSNGDGRLGNGGKGGGAQPSVATVASERFGSITVGGAHACALNLARLAYCWGNDNSGQLGDDRTVSSTTPIPVNGGLAFTTISAGANHTCALSSGKAYCWGSNARGQLGIGVIGGIRDTPQAVGVGFVALSTSNDHTCGLTTAGEALCWGANDSLQIGAGLDSIVPTPTSVGGGAFTQISAGRWHNCAMTAAGTVSCWGLNSSGQLGNGTRGGSAAIGVVSSPVAFRNVTAGSNHTCAQGVDGETYCWGSNVFGALGNELQAAFRPTPQRVAAPR